MTLIKKLYILVAFLILPLMLSGQWSGLMRAGVNFGFINQSSWIFPGFPDIYPYDKPLVRPIFSIGLEYSLSSKFKLRQELLFQFKGQGSERPNYRSFFQTMSPDLLRLMSFPLGLQYQIVDHFYFGIAIQPSLYLNGYDNYWAKEYWRGWIWGASTNIHYVLKDHLEFGLEYDHDFTLYYCPGCEERFLTFRAYTMYHIK